MAIISSDSESLEKVLGWQILAKETGLKFYFNGRIVLGPRMGMCWTLIIHMTLTLALFLIYDGNHYLEGRIYLLGRWGIPFFLILLYFLILLAILKTILTEPGIAAKPIPRIQQQNFLTYIGMAKRKTLVWDNIFGMGSYCQICQMFRQSQVSHCRSCNVCFKRSDHHCEILGVCIAKRNYPSFFVFTFIIFMFYGIILTLGLNSLYIVIITGIENITLNKVILPSLYLVLIGFIFPPCGILTLFITPFIHTYQVLTNRTSKDRARNIWPTNKPKTIKGWISTSIYNCSEILFGLTIRSELRAREEIHVPKGYLNSLTWAKKPTLTKEIYEAAQHGDCLVGSSSTSFNNNVHTHHPELNSGEELETISVVV